jgi:peptidoglycan hydrolase-like protein with peptidoglycan-binding domain
VDYGKIISTIISLLSNSGAAGTVVKALLSALGEMFKTLNVTPSDMNIEWAQRALTKLGYNPGLIDGRSGPMTSRAIVKFQEEHNLTPDGWLGAETQTQLRLLAGEA